MRTAIHPNEFWALVRDSDIVEANEVSLRKMYVVDVSEDPEIKVREVGTGTVHDEPYVRLRTAHGLQVGDPVLVGEIRGRGINVSSTRVILGKIATAPAEGAGTYTDEQVRDVIGTALTAGNNIDINVNDAGDTITIDVETLTSADITDFDAAAVAAVNTLIPHGYVSTTRVAILPNTIPVGPTSAQTLVANRMYYTPFFVPTTRNYDALLFEIMTVVSGNVQVGIYNCDTASFLPTTRVAMGTKTLYGALGVKTQTFTAVSLTGGKWYFAGICSVTAHAIRGTNTNNMIPSLRGGMDADLVTAYCMAFEALTAGWTDIPADASPSSISNIYLSVGARAA